MNRIAKFEKVSFDQFRKDYISCFNQYVDIKYLQRIYDSIITPIRATKGSAGYDFMTPINIYLNPNESIKIPTGIRCKIENGWVLKCYPRSSLGFKYRMQIDNTVGIIDSDYYYSDNEGHIFIKITNDSNAGKILAINANEFFVQGIFCEYGITYDDNVENTRNGGIGSTHKTS